MNFHFRLIFAYDPEEELFEVIDREVFIPGFITAEHGQHADDWASEEMSAADWDWFADDLKKIEGIDLTKAAIYEAVGQAKCESDQHWTDCGYEYDSWCEITSQDVRQLTAEEAQDYEPEEVTLEEGQPDDRK